MLLTCLIFLPVAGIVAILFVNRNQHGLIRNIATGVTALELFLTRLVLFQFDTSLGGMQFVERALWESF